MNRAENAAHISRMTAKQRGDSLARHGCARRGRITPEYYIWQSMRERCRNPRTPGYANYGGRGIEVCERWNSFDNFISDVGPKPTPNHSLDRIDNDGPYSPDNCRWATRAEQNANQRPRKDAIWLTYRGQRKTLDEWSRLTGVRYGTMYARVILCGWTAERAIETPPRNKKHGH